MCELVSVQVTLVMSQSFSVLECILACVCECLLYECQVSVGSLVVLVVVLHHALDVEQFVSQPAAVFLLSPVV